MALLNTEASVKPKLKHPNVDAKKSCGGSNYSICELLVSCLEPDGGGARPRLICVCRNLMAGLSVACVLLLHIHTWANITAT